MAKKKTENPAQDGGGTYKTPRGPAATTAKNKYRDSNYDRAELALPKGMKAAVKQLAGQQGQSFNEYVCSAIKEKAERDTGHEFSWQKEKGLEDEQS